MCIPNYVDEITWFKSQWVANKWVKNPCSILNGTPKPIPERWNNKHDNSLLLFTWYWLKT